MFVSWFLRRGNLAPRSSDNLLALYEQFRTVLVSVLEAGIQEGAFRDGLDVDATAHGIVAGLTGLFVQVRVDPSAADVEDRLFESYTETLLRGLAASG